MNRFILLTLSFILLSLLTKSQEIVSSSGNFFVNETKQISWTLGEPVIEALPAGNVLLTQGFHQPELTVTDISGLAEVKIKVTAYPNPTSGIINLKVINRGSERIFCILSTLDGQILLAKQLSTGISQIPMYDYAPAVYLLKVTADNLPVSTFRIVKK